MQVPLRGELTLPANLPLHAPLTASIAEPSSTPPDAFANLLNHITRLSVTGNQISPMQIAPPAGNAAQKDKPVRPRPFSSLSILGSTVALSKSARETTSPWGSTASETAVAEAALYPFLVHLAVAKDDVESLRFCLGIPALVEQSEEPMNGVDSFLAINSNRSTVRGGIENCLDAASGRTPLHVAAINGSAKCAKVLLEAGALVHIRDSLDHTALYYVSLPPLDESGTYLSLFPFGTV